MADSIEVDVSEMLGLADALDKLPPEIEGKIMDQAMSAGAQIFLDEMIARAPIRKDAPSPRSTGLKPFWIRADLRKRRIKDAIGYIIGPTKATAYVVRWLEYGHMLVRGGRKGKGKVVGHVPAYPFVRPAADAGRAGAIAATSKRLGELVKAYWKQAEKGWQKSA